MPSVSDLDISLTSTSGSPRKSLELVLVQPVVIFDRPLWGSVEPDLHHPNAHQQGVLYGLVQGQEAVVVLA